MTTAGPVSDQPVVPPKASVGRLRDSGSKHDAAHSQADEDQAFGDVLSKLKGENGSASSDANQKVGGSDNLRRQGHSAQRVPEDGNTDSNLTSAIEYLAQGEPKLASDPQLDGMVGMEQAVDQTDAPAPDRQDSDASGVKDIAVLVGLMPMQLAADAAGQEPKTSASRPTAGAVDGAAKSLAIMAQMSEGSEPPIATAAAMAAGDAANAAATAQPQPAGADAAVTRVAATVVSEAKKPDAGDKSQKVAADFGQPPVADSDGAPSIAQRTEVASPVQRVKVKVLQQETHFAPVVRGPPVLHSGSSDEAALGDGGKNATDGTIAAQSAGPTVTAAPVPADGGQPAVQPPTNQIANRVIAEAALGPSQRTGGVPEMPTMKPALKILNIQLQPADLGTVTVRMELKNAELSLHVEADRPETADLIRSDQDTLSKLLRSAGFAVDPASIRVGEGDRTVATQQSGQQGMQTNLQSSPQWQSGSSERQGNNQRGSAAAGAQGGEPAPKTSRNDSYETPTNRTGRGLYI